jgi:hypothetical protein
MVYLFIYLTLGDAQFHKWRLIEFDQSQDRRRLRLLLREVTGLPRDLKRLIEYFFNKNQMLFHMALLDTQDNQIYEFADPLGDSQ